MAMQSKSECGCVSPEVSHEATCFCALNDVIRAISGKYAMSLIAMIGNHTSMRFSEIQNQLHGMSSSTLSIRLEELENAGLIKRRVYPETPPRVEYSLTKDGEELRDRLKPLLELTSSR